MALKPSPTIAKNPPWAVTGILRTAIAATVIALAAPAQGAATAAAIGLSAPLPGTATAAATVIALAAPYLAPRARALFDELAQHYLS